MLHVGSVKDGKPHPVEAPGLFNLILKQCTGFSASLCAPGAFPCYRKDLLSHVPGTSQFVSLCYSSLLTFLHHQQLSQHHSELLCTPCQLPHPLSHFSSCSRGRILKCCCLCTDHNVFEFFTERVAALCHTGPHLRRLGLARQSVANED